MSFVQFGNETIVKGALFKESGGGDLYDAKGTYAGKVYKRVKSREDRLAL